MAETKTRSARDVALDNHFVSRVGWLRAAVLGANDGIVSTASLIVGVAAASGRSEVLLASMAGLAAGALSMAAGEYVSVSSQADTEKADIERERQELIDDPQGELDTLTQIYVERGLPRDLALQVAVTLTEKDALAAHVHDELGIADHTAAQPLLAAVTSALTFAAGAALPLATAWFVPEPVITLWVTVLSLLFLAALGAVGAQTGGSPIWRAVLRVTFWGAVAMAVTAAIGALFGTTIG